MSFSASTFSVGMSSREMQTGCAAAMCMVRSFAKARKSSFDAVSAFPHLTSVSTPTLPCMWM